jgi:hypothetical protein
MPESAKKKVLVSARVFGRYCIQSLALALAIHIPSLCHKPLLPKAK